MNKSSKRCQCSLQPQNIILIFAQSLSVLQHIKASSPQRLNLQVLNKPKYSSAKSRNLYVYLGYSSIYTQTFDTNFICTLFTTNTALLKFLHTYKAGFIFHFQITVFRRYHWESDSRLLLYVWIILLYSDTSHKFRVLFKSPLSRSLSDPHLLSLIPVTPFWSLLSQKRGQDGHWYQYRSDPFPLSASICSAQLLPKFLSYLVHKFPAFIVFLFSTDSQCNRAACSA